VKVLPTPHAPQGAWDSWAIGFGYPYRGQPSVAYAVRIELGVQGSHSYGASDPEGIELLPATPNPFHGTTTLAYRLAFATHVRLAVYDIAGRRVANLVDSIQGAGTHQVTLRVPELPSGVYLTRLEAAGRAVVRPIALVH